jgi:hypothetical protein
VKPRDQRSGVSRPEPTDVSDKIRTGGPHGRPSDAFSWQRRRWTIRAGPGQRRYPRQVEGPPFGRPGRPDRQPITGPQPVTRGSAPIGGAACGTNRWRTSRSATRGIATPVGKINCPASTPMLAPRSCFAWTGEHSRGLADTHRDSSVPIETQIGSEILSDKFATVSECETPELRDDARAFLESEIRSAIPAGDGRCSRVMLQVLAIFRDRMVYLKADALHASPRCAVTGTNNDHPPPTSALSAARAGACPRPAVERTVAPRGASRPAPGLAAWSDRLRVEEVKKLPLPVPAAG